MYFDQAMVKKFLVLLFVIAGVFVGFQLVSDSDMEELGNEAAPEEILYDELYDEDIEITADMIDSPSLSEEFEGTEYSKIQFDNSFEHTKPGEYSEIIVNAGGFEVDEFTIVYVRKAGTEDYIESGGQEHTADEDGNISTRFTITEFGNYEVFLSSGGESFVSQTIVVK